MIFFFHYDEVNKTASDCFQGINECPNSKNICYMTIKVEEVTLFLPKMIKIEKLVGNVLGFGVGGNYCDNHLDAWPRKISGSMTKLATAPSRNYTLT